jgi:2-dehydropantoate 2-reductase
MRIAIFGTGGVGGYFGGRLAQAGEEVTFIARGAHLQALQENGLKVESIQGNFLVRPVRTFADPAEAGVMDLILVAVKSWDVPSAAVAMRPMVGTETLIIPLENGVEASDQLAHALGWEHVLGGTCRISAMIGAPGVIQHLGLNPSITFGELDGVVRERTRALLEVFRRIPSIVVDVADDIHLQIWEKFLLIASLRSLEAKVHRPFKGGPMIGQVPMLSGGGGMIAAPALSLAVAAWTPSTRLCPSKTAGAITTARRTSVKTTAARTGRSPSNRCNF